MSIFQKSVINKYLKNLDNEKVSKAFEQFKQFYGNKLRLSDILHLKEENYQEGFLREIFVQSLGYTIRPDLNYNLTTEYKNQTDSKKADGAIIKNNSAIGVIELKSAKTFNLENIKNQAFKYKHNQPDCRYVITSNFHYLRFYIDNSTEYEEFDLFEFKEQDFKIFYLILSQESIFNDIPLKMKEETKYHEENITDKFYKDYKAFKDQIFENLVKNNTQYDKLTLFKKSQKLLDRFLFVYFGEDCGLCPPNSIQIIIDQWKTLKDNDAYVPLYSRFQKLFGYLDKGHIGKTFEFPAFNGGLFQPDELLDSHSTLIDDKILIENTPKLSAYDFNTDIDVNILGHIFEHSLNEIEEISAKLKGEAVEKSKTKRKKDGVFYTPKYITSYIVENTIGKLCKEKQEELEILEIEIIETHNKNEKITKRGKELYTKLQEYKNWLLTLKILDPACGSGAFLNSALDFLIKEHKQTDDLISDLTGDRLRMFDTDKNILENNIFGVDINEESVEIAKLSLWLRTAKKDRKLSDLNNNIKCGNSLIHNPEIAGEKAFNWHAEFPQVFGVTVIESEIIEIKKEESPDYLKLIKEKALEAKEKAEKAKELSNEAIELTQKVYEFAEKLENLNEADIKYQSKNKGFDVIIGNPPYATKIFLESEKEFYKNNFKTAQYQLDLYILFIEKAVGLVKNKGIIGLITPNSWLKNLTMSDCRKFLLENVNLLSIIPNLPNVFVDASVDSLVFVCSKSVSKEPTKIIELREKEFVIKHVIDQEDFKKNDKFVFSVEINSEIKLIIEKIKFNSAPLSNFFEISRGINPYDSYRGQSKEIIASKAYHADYKKDATFVPELRGKHIGRYFYEWDSKHYISYGNWLAAPRDEKFFKGERILFRQVLSKHLICTVIEEDFKIDQSIFIALPTSSQIKTKFVLSLLASRLFAMYFKFSSNEFDALFPKIKLEEFKNLPIKLVEMNKQDEFVQKVDSMLSQNILLNETKHKFIELLKANFDNINISNKLTNWEILSAREFFKELEKQKIKLSLDQQTGWLEHFESKKQTANSYKDNIQILDREIENLVYQLYELLPEEIAFIEKTG